MSRRLAWGLLFLQSASAVCPSGCISCDANDNCLGPGGATSPSTYDIWCKDGWYGGNCDMACPLGCLHSYCAYNGDCMATRNSTFPDNDWYHAGDYDAAIYCLPLKYGRDCSSSCPTTCSKPYCSSYYGYCINSLTPTPGSDASTAGYYDRAVWCQTGYYGSSCENDCSVNCSQPYCSTSGYCMATPIPVANPPSDYYAANDVDRAIFCKDGWWGANCQNTCPTNCAEPFCSASGYCMSAPDNSIVGNQAYGSTSNQKAFWCKDGFYGQDCSSVCPMNCSQPYCDTYGNCITTPTATSASSWDLSSYEDRATFCKDGTYGSSCQSQCPAGCAQAWCSVGGSCMACTTGVNPMGEDTYSVSYDRAHYCKDGFYGDTCTSSCPANCAHSWCSKSGYCLASADRTPLGDYEASNNHTYDAAIWCKTGYYDNDCSGNCTAACPSGCAADGSCQTYPGNWDNSIVFNQLNCLPTSAVPNNCTSDLGTCGWYSSCLTAGIYYNDSCPIVDMGMKSQCMSFAAASLSSRGMTWNTQRETCVQQHLASLWNTSGQYGSQRCDVVQSQWTSNMMPCFSGLCGLGAWDKLQYMIHGDPLLVTSVWYQPTLFGAQVAAACNAYFYQINAWNTSIMGFAGVDTAIKAKLMSSFDSRWEVAFTNLTTSTFAVAITQSTNYTGSTTIAFHEWYLQAALAEWLATSMGSHYALSINNETMLNASSYAGAPTSSPTPAPTSPTNAGSPTSTAPTAPTAPTTKAPTMAGMMNGTASPTKGTISAAPTASVALSMFVVLLGASLL